MATTTGGVPPPRLLSPADYSGVRAGSSSGTLKAKTDFTYDTRGNVTRETRGVSPVTATTRHTYDTYGNLTQTTDARNNVVKLTYDAITNCPDGSASNLYPTQREEAHGKTEERTTTYAYDCESGLLTSRTDTDNSVATGYDYDDLGRVEAVDEGGKRKTQTTYDDPERRVYEQRDRAAYNDGGLAVASRYDPLGRLWLEQTNDTDKVSASSKTSGIQVRRAYRYSGSNRYELASNPHESDSASEETMGWSRTKYDRNGRVVEAAAFASDGLGRLRRLQENSVNTCYKYAVLDNLTEVRQNATVSGGVCTGGRRARSPTMR